MVGCGYRESCRELFKELKILPLSSQYIFSLLLFVVIIGITLFQIMHTIAIIPDKKNDLCLPRGKFDHVSEGSLLFRYQIIQHSSQGNYGCLQQT
jgi:hypothetical protein